MKTLFTFLALVLSVSAFAVESQKIFCNVGIAGERYVELEMFFPTTTTVQSHVIENGNRVPIFNEIVITDHFRIVTNYIGQSDVKTIIVPLPNDLFSSEEGSFWIVPAVADDKDVWAACVN